MAGLHLDVTSNHLEIAPARPGVMDEVGEELSKRVENFGLPVGKSMSITSSETPFVNSRRQPERRTGAHCKTRQGAGDSGSLYSKEGA